MLGTARGQAKEERLEEQKHLYSEANGRYKEKRYGALLQELMRRHGSFYGMGSLHKQRYSLTFVVWQLQDPW